MLTNTMRYILRAQHRMIFLIAVISCVSLVGCIKRPPLNNETRITRLKCGVTKGKRISARQAICIAEGAGYCPSDKGWTTVLLGDIYEVDSCYRADNRYKGYNIGIDVFTGDIISIEECFTINCDGRPTTPM